ncbi:oxidoreductase NAD-binding domain-containing protein 1 [Brienomyrus brachyistius]|uniref:oxidoreductase NAD-binding domain-containing protein 1 n=1 Tax=Brienomyrus brachyistius TaxID=42636 RepID=UPI0020B1AA6C|nr:oxidoreductase NAD-binding domain-containing protein 1 [Brienomyrus brachyistius]
MSVRCFLGPAAVIFSPSGVCGLLRPCAAARKMSTRQKDHLERTAANHRQTALFPAKVCGITEESDTVRRLSLTVSDPKFTFKAGQWVDFFIPDLSTVGGFSICSSPGLLRREGVIELAVKYSQHPPAHWIHRECRVDSEVALRVGGDFFFDPQPWDRPVDLLLLAGGVGINPLLSILLHAADLLRGPSANGAPYRPGSIRLCYSARSSRELLFKNTILDLCQEFPGTISCDFFVTRQSDTVEPHLGQHVREGRITEQVLKDHLERKEPQCYLCGPPPMINSISDRLLHLGLPQDRILYEKWW